MRLSTAEGLLLSLGGQRHTVVILLFEVWLLFNIILFYRLAVGTEKCLVVIDTKKNMLVQVIRSENKLLSELSISYCPHARALTDINDRGKVELPKRAQPETVRGQPAFPRSLMSVNARVL